MRKTILISVAAVCVIAVLRCAQAQTPDPIATLTAEWNAYLHAQGHVITSLIAVQNELNKTKAELAAVTKERDELKAEREKPKGDADRKP